MTPLIFTLTFVSILFFAVSLLLSFRNYKNRFQVEYNPKNMFPYELNFEMKFKDNLAGNILLIVLMVTEAALYIVFKRSQSTNGIVTLICVMGLLSAVIMPFIYFVPLKLLKFHLAMDVIFFISNFVALVSLAINSLIEYQTFLDIGNLILAIICIVLVLVYAVIIFNPKISTWAKMDKVTNSDGTYYYKRPKFFPLAYTEWLIILFNIVILFLTFVSYLA